MSPSLFPSILEEMPKDDPRQEDLVEADRALAKQENRLPTRSLILREKDHSLSREACRPLAPTRRLTCPRREEKSQEPFFLPPGGFLPFLPFPLLPLKGGLYFGCAEDCVAEGLAFFLGGADPCEVLAFSA